MRSIVLILASLTFIACQGPVEVTEELDPEPWFSSITTDTVFGLQLGNQYSEETPSGDTAFYFTDIIESPDSVQITSSIANSLVHIIKIKAFSESALVGEHYSNLKLHLDSLYGESKAHEFYATWNTGATDGRLVEVQLTNSQAIFNKDRIVAEWRLVEDRLYED